MTCREILEMNHPECINVEFVGGCRGCPNDYEYLPKPENCLDISCTDCWDREIPGTTKKSMKTIPIDYTHIFSFVDKCMKEKDRYVSIYFTTDGSVTVSVYPNSEEKPDEQDN